MNKFREIITAWRIKWKPTPEQTLLAEKRLKVCEGCSYRKEVSKKFDFFVVCSECGCPLEAKAHSPKKGACGIGKWDIVDGLK